MKPSASRIEHMLAKIEATLVPPPRKWLWAIIDGDDEAEAKEKKEKALACTRAVQAGWTSSSHSCVKTESLRERDRRMGQ
jgi:hypothetical protein